MSRMLEDRYGELQLARGFQSGSVIEIWFDRNDGSWTIARSLPDGRMCVLGAGSDFEVVEQPDSDDEAT